MKFNNKKQETRNEKQATRNKKLTRAGPSAGSFFAQFLMKTLSFRLVFPLLLGAAASARAQSPYVGESVYYSRLQFAGPARTQGIAGANVALGADFGNLTSNPAGLGLFRQSEVHFSPGLGLGSADADGTGPAQNATKNSFHIASVGGVFTSRRADDDASSDWRGGSFALGFSRLADFNTSFRYSGTVADNRSLFQRLREPGGTALGGPGYGTALDGVFDQYTDNLYTDLDGLAFGTYLTNFSGTGDTLDITAPVQRDAALPVPQTETITRSGSVSQLDFGYGGSYKERLFVGGAIGIVTSNSNTVRDFAETRNAADLGTSFGSLLLRDAVKTTGTGINARLGLIYRLNDALRLGASVQTPTYIQFTDTYSTSLTTQFSQPVTFNTSNGQVSTSGERLSLPSGQYAYTLTTPFRANGGAALTIGKYGFLTADVEYVGYQQARLNNNPSDVNGDDTSFALDNEAIRTAYQNAVNVRLGGEARLDIFRVRAGYARYGDPYRTSTLDRAQNFYTAGVGFRQNNFYLDVAGVYTTYQQLYSPYALANGQQPLISVNANRYTTTVTAGFTF